MSAAVLAQDVARHPHAARLADVLDRVLALTPNELAMLADPAPDEVRDRVRAACDAPRQAGHRDGVWSGQQGDHGPVEVLDGVLLGTLVDLEAMLEREEPLVDAPPAARRVALDAVMAAWAGITATLSDLSALAGPWERALPLVGPPLPETPRTPMLRGLLEDVARRTPEQWSRTAEAHRTRRGDHRWSQAMHEACVAAYDAKRLHEVARAQLAAARTLALANTGPMPSAAGMAVTAAVQAVCTADLISGSVLVTLTGDWEAGS